MADGGAPDVALNIPVNDAEALAKLRRLQLEAERARMSLAGLPEPGGMGHGRNLRLPSLPSTSLGSGSRANALRHNLAWRPQPGRLSAYRPGADAPEIPVHIPADPVTAGNRLIGPPHAPTIPFGPSGQAPRRVNTPGESGLLRMKQSGLDAGPLKLGMGGVSGLGVAGLMRALGPAAGYAALAVGIYKSVEALTEFGEAVERRQDAGESLGQALSGEIGALERSFASSLFGKAFGVGDIIMRAQRLQMLVMGGPDIAQHVAEYQRQAGDFIAAIEGRESSKMQHLNALGRADEAEDRIILRAQREAARMAEKAADTLWGAGFPGTRKELQGELGSAFLDAEALARAVEDARYAAMRENEGLRQ